MLYGLLLSFGALSAAHSVPPRLAIQMVRFYVPSAKQTQVIGFLQVPYSMTEPVGNRIAWETTFVIRDIAGLELGRESWWSGAPAAARGAEAMGVQPLHLPPMAAGRYLLQISVKDSTSGKTATVEDTVEAFSVSPGVSDLLLASAMRKAPVGDTVSAPGEFSHGSYRFVTSPDLKLDAVNPVVSYLLEAYTDIEAQVSVVVAVLESSGKRLYTVPATKQVLPAGGGVIGGQLPLEGLAEGNYTLVVNVVIDGRSVERSAHFAIGALQAAVTRHAASRVAAKGIDESYFADKSEEELDELADVLQLVATSKQISVYKKSGKDRLSLTAKRAFLVGFWAERDQNKATPENENRIAFYTAIDYVNQHFTEAGRGARPGWKTERGRVWTHNGAPDENYRRPQEGRAPAYEVWRYSRGRARYYIFADRTGLGQYTLMKTNDLKEVGNAGWLDIMGPDAVRDLGQLLGVNFFETSPGSTNRSFGDPMFLR